MTKTKDDPLDALRSAQTAAEFDAALAALGGRIEEAKASLGRLESQFDSAVFAGGDAAKLRVAMSQAGEDIAAWKAALREGQRRREEAVKREEMAEHQALKERARELQGRVLERAARAVETSIAHNAALVEMLRDRHDLLRANGALEAQGVPLCELVNPDTLIARAASKLPRPSGGGLPAAAAQLALRASTTLYELLTGRELYFSRRRTVTEGRPHEPRASKAQILARV